MLVRDLAIGGVSVCLSVSLSLEWHTLATSAISLQDGLDGLEVCSWCRSSLSQWPLRTRYCHLRSSASAICSDWHSTGSTPQDCNWTTKFRSQRTSHREPSATRTAVTGPVWERLKRALKTHLFSTARRHWDVFMILAPDINIQTYLLYLPDNRYWVKTIIVGPCDFHRRVAQGREFFF